MKKYQIIILMVVLASLCIFCMTSCGKSGGFGVGGNVNFFGAGS